MSKKKLTHQQVREIQDEYQNQMNILNGNPELDNAVTDYVTYLENELAKKTN
jgi:hypothetical protein|tara:strand:- start:1368 stop:1523 length:156 start_codon:yes stop_codon:yes gene_type:complete